jgi:hypothetical protein
VLLVQQNSSSTAAARAAVQTGVCLHLLLFVRGVSGGGRVAACCTHLRAVAVRRSLTFCCRAWLNSHCSTR